MVSIIIFPTMLTHFAVDQNWAGFLGRPTHQRVALLDSHHPRLFHE